MYGKHWQITSRSPPFRGRPHSSPLTLSGLPVHSFTFRGFAPRKSGQRQHFFEIDKDSPHTLIFYESPHRLLAFLKDALAVYGDRSIAVCNDLTKKFELIDRGRISDMIRKYSAEEPRGEYCIVINAEGSKVEFDALYEDGEAEE